MKEFEEFIKSGEVRMQTVNSILNKALINSSFDRLEFVKRLNIKTDYKYIVENAYDVLRELIESQLAVEGYKSYSHEATILFLKKFKDITEQEISMLDNLRKVRIGLKYYGKESNPEDARQTLVLLKTILPKLKKILKIS